MEVDRIRLETLHVLRQSKPTNKHQNRLTFQLLYDVRCNRPNTLQNAQSCLRNRLRLDQNNFSFYDPFLCFCLRVYLVLSRITEFRYLPVTRAIASGLRGFAVGFFLDIALSVSIKLLIANKERNVN